MFLKNNLQQHVHLSYNYQNKITFKKNTIIYTIWQLIFEHVLIRQRNQMSLINKFPTSTLSAA